MAATAKGTKVLDKAATAAKSVKQSRVVSGIVQSANQAVKRVSHSADEVAKRMKLVKMKAKRALEMREGQNMRDAMGASEKFLKGKM